MNPRPDLKLVNSHKPTGTSTGLEPYLALEPRRISENRATDWRDWRLAYLWIVLALAVYAGIAWGMGWFRWLS